MQRNIFGFAQPTYLNNTGNSDVSGIIISFTLCELNFLLTLILVRKKKNAVSSADDLNRDQMSLNIPIPPPPPTRTAANID